MTTPQWFRDSKESKETIHNRLTELETSTRKHLCILRHNQHILENTIKKLNAQQTPLYRSPPENNVYSYSKPLTKQKLLEKTFQESNRAILKIVVESAVKNNPAVIPWIHQQLTRYMRFPYIPSIKTQLTKFNHHPNTSETGSYPSDDESM